MARIGWLLMAVLMAAPAPGLARKPKPAPPPAAAAAPPVPSVRTGVELWAAGDYAGAVAMWQPFANGGDADAMFNIGQAYKLGRGVAKDVVVARDWYRRAALKGHLPAQANLGISLFQAGEKPEAIRWLKSAADKNEMRAQYVLGVAQWNGDGVLRNLTLAYGYLSRAAALGLPEATTALGTLSPMLSPQDRANGTAVASSLAAGAGVPPEFAGPASALASNDRFSRDQVIKATPPAVPPPHPAAAAPPPPAAAGLAANAPLPAAAAPVVVKPAAPILATAAPVAPAPKPPPAANVPPVATAGAAPLPTHPAAAAVAPPVATFAIPAAAPPAPRPEVAPKPIAVAEAAPVKPPVPNPPKAAEAPPKAVVARPAGWRVQLGAFSKRTLAEAAWAEVKLKQKALVAHSGPIYAEDGKVTKLQMGPFASKDAARDACAKIAFSGRACFVTEG